MSNPVTDIEEIINRETLAWNTQNLDLLMTIFHPDMVWPWPRTPQAHDPMDWVLELGRFNDTRWRQGWQILFETHTLVHNIRHIRQIVVSPEGDGAFAVVDVDTLWRDKQGHDSHWFGRACKIYTQVGGEWKMIAQTGLLVYPATGPHYPPHALSPRHP
jgi:ketosteroid isomerase-like protein